MQTISIDINKVQKGDETEFRLLFNLFYPRLMSVACRFVPEHIAEDIVQSVFVMYWEQKSALIPNAIHSFLYKRIETASGLRSSLYVSIISILEIIRQLQRPSFLWTDACSCCNAI